MTGTGLVASDATRSSPTGSYVQADTDVQMTGLRSCPIAVDKPVGQNAWGLNCQLEARLADGTTVQMHCWVSTFPPEPKQSAKWFSVTVTNGTHQGETGWVWSDLVHARTRTPECDHIGYENVPIPTFAPQEAPSGRATAPPDPSASRQQSPAKPGTAPATGQSNQVNGSDTERPPTSATWTEQTGTHGAPTFVNPHNASQPGARIPPMTNVTVVCRAYAPEIKSVNPDGWWYKIASDPWNGQYYAAANTFWNGDIPGQQPYTHNTDFSVPAC